MCRLTQLFSVEELEALDAKQLTILREAILCEIRTSPEIRAILLAKFGPMRDRMAAEHRPRRPRGSGSRRTPEPGT